MDEELYLRGIIRPIFVLIILAQLWYNQWRLHYRDPNAMLQKEEPYFGRSWNVLNSGCLINTYTRVESVTEANTFLIAKEINFRF